MKENIKEHNLNWPEILDHPRGILTVKGSGFGGKNALLNLINYEPDIDEIYLFVKDPYKAKHRFLNNKIESANNWKVFSKYSNKMNDICKNIEEYNPNKKRKTLIVFDDMIADMHNNKKIIIK